MSVSLPQNDERTDLPAENAERRWQFSLRTLMLWVAVTCGLFAILSRVGPLWSAAIIWFLILAAGHVLGNVWGSRASRMRPAENDSEKDSRGLQSPRPVTFAPTTRLCQKTQLGWIMPTVTVVAALLGGAAGCFALAWLRWGEVSYAGLLVGTISAAILGGFFGFLASSFVEVSARAFNEAAGEGMRGKIHGRS